MIADPMFYAIAAPALLVMGISKGGFGAGIGILAVPLMTLVIPPVQAAAIILPILCFMDLFGLWAYRRSWDAVNLKIMIPPSVVGICLGALSFGLLDERWIGLMIGVIALVFTLNRWLGRPVPAAGLEPGRLRGSFWAMTSGFTSFLSHAGGPPANVYLLPQNLDKTVYVGTTVIFFAFINYTKLIPYAWLGILNTDNLLTALALSPTAPIGMLLGMWLHKRIEPAPFYRVCYFFVFLAGLKLIFDNVRVAV